MLAVRSFTRAEILLRLFKDTPNLANERDRETVDQVLQSVAVLNVKTGAYELKHETMLNEVNDEWQFYSQTEKSYVKRAINKIKQGPPPSTQPTTSSQEPTAPLKATGSSSIGVGGQKSTASALVLYYILFKEIVNSDSLNSLHISESEYHYRISPHISKKYIL